MMDKRKNYRYVVIDLGSNISGDLFSTTPSHTVTSLRYKDLKVTNRIAIIR